MGGVFREVVPGARLVNTEAFDEAWYPGEAQNTTVFTANGAVTEVTITVLYQSTEARDAASRSGMEHGMFAGFDRLEKLLLADAPPPHVVAAPMPS